MAKTEKLSHHQPEAFVHIKTTSLTKAPEEIPRKSVKSSSVTPLLFIFMRHPESYKVTCTCKLT